MKRKKMEDQRKKTFPRVITEQGTKVAKLEEFVKKQRKVQEWNSLPNNCVYTSHFEGGGEKFISCHIYDFEPFKVYFQNLAKRDLKLNTKHPLGYTLSKGKGLSLVKIQPLFFCC